MRQFESIGQYHDLWGWLLLSAPNNFRPINDEHVDQDKALREAFDSLRAGFHLAERKIKDERVSRIAREMIEMSYEAYSSGGDKQGAHILQECEGMIWKQHSLRIKYAVEAERRAFGEVVLYKSVRVSKFPYEGTSGDLTVDQRALLEIAESHCRSYLAAGKHFHFFAWARENNGHIIRISAEPKSDTHDAPAPLQKSWLGTYNRLKDLAREGQIRASVLTEVAGPGGDGLLSHVLEQKAAPRIKAVCLFHLKADGTLDYEAMRFHLDDPDIFPEPEGV